MTRPLAFAHHVVHKDHRASGRKGVTRRARVLRAALAAVRRRLRG
ncbi:MAG TPA: hypothetical protein VHK89_05890 [Actinomycetota bacterium]|nr:hypothetical protein [Actinomycetota bacterium]